MDRMQIANGSHFATFGRKRSEMVREYFTSQSLVDRSETCQNRNFQG
jgi:hypothetical protein